MSMSHPARQTATWSRILDVVVCVLGLILFSPVMLVIVFALLIESGRPIFFSQTRLGQHGRHFRLFKFRKFKKSAGEAGRPLTVRGDDRLSPIGRFLEASKLDELPQLYNILKGDMALVGPRPESLAFADCFRGEARAVLAYRPGIFGPSQVAFRNEGAMYPPGQEPTRLYRQVLFPTKVQLDLSYYPYRTLLSDCGWIARGVLAVAGVYKDAAVTHSIALDPSVSGSSAAVLGRANAANGFTRQI